MNIGVVGLGLIGGSICKSLKKYDKTAVIYGYDTDVQTVALAKEKKAIQVGVLDFSEFACCEVVFVAVPVERTAEVIEKLLSVTGENCIISDCASVKEVIEKKIQSPRYIGGHPMAGVESGGFVSSREYMFENAYYVLTGDYKSEAYKKVEALVLCMRAIPVFMSAAEHDAAVCKISHLPHMVAYTLVNTSLVSENTRRLAAGGFKDITRVASSSPALWSNISLKNKENLARDIDKFIQQLQGLKTMIVDEKKTQLQEYFEQGKEKRDSLQGSVGGLNLAFTLKINISDKVGSIYKVMRILAKNKISIANVNIENSREGENGVLSLVFFDSKSKEIATKILLRGGVQC